MTKINKKKGCQTNIKSRITFFEKKRFQPFMFFGARYNLLYSYKYNTQERYLDIDDYIISNIKKGYINYTHGMGSCYKFNRNRSGITLEIEWNNDNQLRKENLKYFTNWKYGKATGSPKSNEAFYGGKFQSLLVNLAYRHYFWRLKIGA